jgi:hypothetical protein
VGLYRVQKGLTRQKEPLGFGKAVGMDKLRYYMPFWRGPNQWKDQDPEQMFRKSFSLKGAKAKELESRKQKATGNKIQGGEHSQKNSLLVAVKDSACT